MCMCCTRHLHTLTIPGRFRLRQISGPILEVILVLTCIDWNDSSQGCHHASDPNQGKTMFLALSGWDSIALRPLVSFGHVWIETSVIHWSSLLLFILFIRESVLGFELRSQEPQGTSGNLREPLKHKPQAGSSPGITAIRKQPGMRDCIPLDVSWESRRQKWLPKELPSFQTMRSCGHWDMTHVIQAPQSRVCRFYCWLHYWRILGNLMWYRIRRKMSSCRLSWSVLLELQNGVRHDQSPGCFCNDLGSCIFWEGQHVNPPALQMDSGSRCQTL